MSAYAKMKMAVNRLILSQPFYASLLLRMKRVEDKSSKTAFWCDGATLGFNPDKVEGMREGQVVGGICEMVEGIAHCHHLRRGTRRPDVWQRASQNVRAYWATRANFEIPDEDKQKSDGMYGGMSAEEQYAIILKKENQKQNQQNQKQNQKQDDDDGGNGNGNGSGTNSGNSGNSGEIRDFPAQNELQKEMEEEKQKTANQQAAAIAKAQGSMPDSAKRILEELNADNAVDWRTELRKFIQTVVHTKYDWTKPNQKYTPLGMYIPKRHNKEIGRIVVAIDTSGSIDNKLLDSFLSEVSAILQDNPTATVKFLSCDAECHDGPELTADDTPINEKKLDLIGGGGTDFAPVFKFVEENFIEPPKCLIYFTDLYGDFPKDAPDYPVLWANYGDKEGKAPFGEMVYVPQESDD